MILKVLHVLTMPAIFPSIFLLCVLPSVFSADAGNETDLLALLSIKSHITSDPYHIMPSWNESIPFCNWTGIICSQRHQRVVTLNLWSGGFSGSVSPAVGNLSFLRELLLHNNSFTGSIPQEVGRLSRLTRLGISNNSFSGEIPSNISQCLNLIELDLSGNNFIGFIPNEFQSLTKLLFINLHSNNLTGEIPKFLGNFTALTFISGLGNNFHGSIPDTLGRLSSLWFFGFAMNNLSGTLPPSFFNMSSLTNIDLPDNQIGGSLPSDIAQRLPKLTFFNLPINKFSGPIPVSLSNASNLEVLALNNNAFTGSVPTFGALQKLQWFVVDSNQLGNGNADDLNFLSSLVNCTSLRSLGFGHNNLGGILPKSMFNFTQLTSLTAGVNLISGNIPSEIGQLVNISRLYLSSNQLAGTIPDSIGFLQNLGVLSLSRNSLSGTIPSSLGNLTHLNMLYLGHNSLEGTVPFSLTNCKGLQLLDLSVNNLSSYIPKGIFGLSSLTLSLDLSDNNFVGSVPVEVGALQNLVSFDVSNNMLSGIIPSSLGSCTSMVVLSMAGNFFQGGIPSSFTSLRGLEVLDLSRNNLTGTIPDYLADLVFLKNLNLSFNDFDGEVPEAGVFKNVSLVSVYGNAKLCGGFPVLQLPRCSFEESSRRNGLPLSLLITIPIFGVIFVLVLVVTFYLVYKRRCTKKVSAENSSDSEYVPQVSYGSLHTATDGFSSANLIGSGKFSYVYKGIVPQKKGPVVVAVKVLKLTVRGANKSFLAECEALGSIRHRNLVRILTSCSGVDHQGNDFKALVYPYMVNGSLEEWLHPNPSIDLETEKSPRYLNFTQRLSIVMDVASALDYIHRHCGTPMVHCDIKPSNVLLDVDLVAHLGDFGLAKFLQQPIHDSSTSHTSSLGVKGTVGYAAPEYGMGSKMSTYGDIYSFGILILEIFTGKRPTDDMFNNGLNLHTFVKMSVPHQVMEITDPLLFRNEEEKNVSKDFNMQDHGIYGLTEDSLISVYQIGIACSVESPRDRIDIGNVIDRLQLIKDSLGESMSKSTKR